LGFFLPETEVNSLETKSPNLSYSTFFKVSRKPLEESLQKIPIFDSSL